MLIRDDGATWTAIGQPAHAWLAGQLARAWSPRPDADVLLAVEQHDVAWSEHDRRPLLHVPARRAASFLEVPSGARLEMWRHVAHRVEAQSPYAALLVSMHATNITTRYGDPSNRPLAFLAEQEADQAALLAGLGPLGITRTRAERDADLLFRFDAMSLALCQGAPQLDLDGPDGGALQLRAPTTESVTLDPWPFASPQLRVWLHARTFSRRFEGEPELRRAFAEAPYTRLEWTLRPAP